MPMSEEENHETIRLNPRNVGAVGAVSGLGAIVLSLAIPEVRELPAESIVTYSVLASTSGALAGLALGYINVAYKRVIRFMTDPLRGSNYK
jgi:hypothetical protein